MWYVSIFILLGLFLLFYPFKVKIYNIDNYLYINIIDFINVKINLFSILNDLNEDKIKKQKSGVKIIKQLKFKEIDLKINGLNFDYRLNGGYFGILYAFLGTIDNILLTRGVLFNYDLSYDGDKSVEFYTIVRARFKNILKFIFS